MASEAGKQTITIHILSNISRNRGNQTMKFGQLIEDNVRNTFLQKSCRKLGKETGLIPLFEKDLYEAEASGQQLSFNTL